MKNLLFLIFGVFWAAMLCSQSLSPRVLGSSGAYQTSVGFSLSSTFGQPLNVATVANGGSELTQGFQQPSGQVVNSCNLVYTLTPSGTSCNGICDGSVTASIVSGDAPFTYLWSDGQTGSTATGLCASMYYITITDSGGCTVNDSILISEPAVLSLSFTTSDVSSCGADDGIIDLTPIGGTSPFGFNWQSGQATEDITGLAAGAYAVLMTDANGCTANANINISEPPGITTSITGTDVTTCGGSDGSADLVVTGGVTPFTYFWSNGDTVEDISSLSPGTYSVTLNDSTGCTVNDQVIINDLAAISVAVTSIDASCNGQCDGKTIAVGSLGTGPYIYEWDDLLLQSSDTASDLCAGTYNVTVTDANQCVETGTVTVIEPLPIGLTITTVDASCGNADGIAMVTASGGVAPYEYSWSSGDTTETDSALAAGINYVIVTDANGCVEYGAAAISNSTTAITVDSVVNLNCSDDADGSIDISVSGGVLPYTYSWSNADSVEDLTGLIGGIYEIVVTDANGCIATQSITVNAPDPLLLFVTTSEASCNGADGVATVTTLGGTAPYTYIWSTFGTTSSQSGLAAGLYLVNVTDSSDCFNSITAEVSNAGGPLITLNSQTNNSCGNPLAGAIDISVSGGSSPYGYQWSNGSTTQDISSLADTTYNVLVTDFNGCIGSGSYDISTELPSIQEICLISVDSVTGMNLITWEKTPGPVSYNIYKEGTASGVYFLLGNVPFDSLSLYIDPSANPLQRSWRYRISAIDSCGNESDLSAIHKTMHLAVNIGLSQQINLIWDPYEGFNYVTYIIYREIVPLGLDSIDAIPGNLSSYTDLNPPNGSLFYVVSAIHPSGCVATKQKNFNSAKSNTSTAVSSVGTLAVSATSADASNGNCDGTATAIVSGGTGPYTYLWDDPSLQATQIAVALCPGNYTVLITDANGDTASASVTVNEQTGVGNLVYLNSISVYPNPSTGEFTLVMNVPIPQKFEIVITNILGQSIYAASLGEIDGEFSHQINLSSNGAGVYSLQLITSDGTTNMNLVIE